MPIPRGFGESIRQSCPMTGHRLVLAVRPIRFRHLPGFRLAAMEGAGRLSEGYRSISVETLRHRMSRGRVMRVRDDDMRKLEAEA